MVSDKHILTALNLSLKLAQSYMHIEPLDMQGKYVIRGVTSRPLSPNVDLG
jgi:hypothetical protein